MESKAYLVWISFIIIFSGGVVEIFNTYKTREIQNVNVYSFTSVLMSNFLMLNYAVHNNLSTMIYVYFFSLFLLFTYFCIVCDIKMND